MPRIKPKCNVTITRTEVCNILALRPGNDWPGASKVQSKIGVRMPMSAFFFAIYPSLPVVSASCSSWFYITALPLGVSCGFVDKGTFISSFQSVHTTNTRYQYWNSLQNGRHSFAFGMSERFETIYGSNSLWNHPWNTREVQHCIACIVDPAYVSLTSGA